MTTELKRPGIWGIDLGQCALKAIRLELGDEEGQIKATAFDYIEHPKILSQPDADPDQLTREALEKFLSRNDLKGDLIAISVPGQSGLARFVKLPPVDEKKIPDIVRFEAKQQIPFPLEEVVWAYQRLGSGMASDNMILDAEIGLFAMKRDMVNRYLQHFKDVNVEVHVIQMAPLALCNFVAHDLLNKGALDTDGEEAKGGKNCVVALDIGADNSNLVITDGEKIIWQRPIPLGGNHFTRALTKDLKLTFAKAEHLKRNAVKSPDLKKILAALKPVLNDFVSEVQRSLGYFTNTHRDATIQYMLGLGNAFRLPGLQKYLQEKLQLEVRKLQKIERLSGLEAVTEAPQYVENVLSFAVAHGLALQGLQATRLKTNLLPPEIARERFIRAKKPWAAAAAAVLLLICPPLLVGYAAVNRAWTNPAVNTALTNLGDNAGKAKNDVAKWKQYQDEAEASKKKILTMAGGINERLNWLYLNNLIDEALPRPNGTHLVDSTRKLFRTKHNYYTKEDGGNSGSKAYAYWYKFRDKIGRGEALSADELKQEETIVKRNLVQINIESVLALYSDDLPAEFFGKLVADESKEKTCYKLLGLGPTEAVESVRGGKKEALPKAGWVVEIRGFSYHDDREKFVLNTFVENLADLATPDPAKRKLADVKLHPKTEEALRGQDEKPSVGYVFLYDYMYDLSPRPGEFRLISRSSVTDVLAGGGAAAAKGPPGGGKVEAGATDTGVDRTKWHPPSGTVFSEGYTGGGGFFGGNPGSPGGPPSGRTGPAGGPPPAMMKIGSSSGAGGNIQGKMFIPGSGQPSTSAATTVSSGRQPRTEFVIMFVWREPGLSDSGAGAPK
jgi:type IV pilus assembly protein PilM